MKPFVLPFVTWLCAMLFLLTDTVSAQTPTPLYINFLTHNENNDYCLNGKYVAGCGYEDAATFAAVRRNTKLLADTIRVKNASWNFQSDWTFVVGVFTFDNKGDASTNGKNIIRWFREDNNNRIEIDAHSHEDFGYNYADVVKLLDSAGGKPTTIVGGFTYNTRMNDATTGGTCMKGRTWDALAHSLSGTKFPSFKYTFEILWGGAFGKEVNGCVQTGHTNDAHALGIWRPKAASNTDFFVHDPKQPLLYLGNGYGNSVDSTGNVQENINQVIAVLDSIQSGKLPPNKLYVYCIDIHQKYFRWAGYPAKVGQLIEALKPYVQQGRLVWNTLTDKVNLWRTKYNSEPNMHPYQFKTTNVRSETAMESLFFAIAPNPTSDNCRVHFTLSKPERVKISLCNVLGQEVAQILDAEMSAGEHSCAIAAANYHHTTLFLRLQTPTISTTKPLQVIR